MWRFIARRLLWSVFLFTAVTFITYVIFFVAPNDPAKLAAGKSASAEQVAAGCGLPQSRRAGLEAVRPLDEAARGRAVARPVVRQPPGRERDHCRRGARHRVARVRRRHPVAPGLDPDRRPLGAPAALAARSRGDDLRAHRDLGTSRLDRADPLLRLRVVPGPDADHRLLRHDQPVRRRGVRRPDPLGVPS